MKGRARLLSTPWPGLLVGLITTMCSAAAADERPYGGSVMVAPTAGQSQLARTVFRRLAMRYELRGEGRIGLLTAGLGLGFSHFLKRHAPRDDDCVDPIVQGCVGNAGTSPARVVLADTVVALAVEALRTPTFALIPRLDLVLPTSKSSRIKTLRFAAHLGLDGELNLGEKLRVVFLARLRQDFYGKAFDSVEVVERQDYGAADPGPFGFRTAGSHLAGREAAVFSSRPFINPDGEAIPVGSGVNWLSGVGRNARYGQHVSDVLALLVERERDDEVLLPGLPRDHHFDGR